MAVSFREPAELVTTVRLAKMSASESAEVKVPERLNWVSLAEPTESKVWMMAPVPFGSMVMLPLEPVVVREVAAELVKRGEVTEVEATNVVTPDTAPALMLTPLMVPVVLAVMVEVTLKAPA